MYLQDSAVQPAVPRGASASMRLSSASGVPVAAPCRFLASHFPDPVHLRIFCFPHAGGSTALFAAWPAAFPPGVQLCPVYLPGRERRAGERPYTQLLPLVQSLARDLLPYLDTPFAFFGHSMGALIGFELARHLRQSEGLSPIHVFVAACQPPHLFKVRQRTGRMTKEEMIAELRRLQGTPENVLRNDELLELIYPMLAADFAACETYVYEAADPLDCSISAYGGQEDHSVENLDGWSLYTRQTFTCTMFPGDHFFVQRAESPLLQQMALELTALLDLPCEKTKATTREGVRNHFAHADGFAGHRSDSD